MAIKRFQQYKQHMLYTKSYKYSCANKYNFTMQKKGHVIRYETGGLGIEVKKQNNYEYSFLRILSEVKFYFWKA